MQQTETLKLNLIEGTDTVDPAPINENFQTVEGVLAEQGEAIQAALTELGSGGGKLCRIAYGSYTGTNTYGQSNPSSLTVDFYPVLAVVGSNYGAYISSSWPTVLIRGLTLGRCELQYSTQFAVTWTDDGLSWYGESREAQNNVGNEVYYYCVIGYDNSAE